MSLQLGTPITYRDNNGYLFPGFVSGNNGTASNYMIYFDTTQSGAVASYKITSLPTRDDTLSSNNTYAVLGLTASAVITGA